MPTRMKVLTIYRFAEDKRIILEVQVLAGKPLPGQRVVSEETGEQWRIDGTSETRFYDPYTARERVQELMKQGFWDVSIVPVSGAVAPAEGEHLRTV